MALLIYLRLRATGSEVRRRDLPGQLWFERGEEASELTRNAVSDLRDLLGKALRSSPNLWLDPAAVACDADEIQDLMALHGDRADEALAIYRGVFLDGWTRQRLHPTAKPGNVAYADAFVDWIEDRRLYLHGRVVRQVVASAETAAAGKDWPRLQRLARRLLELTNFDASEPRGWLWLLECANALGTQADVAGVRAQLEGAGNGRVLSSIPDDVRRQIESIWSRRSLDLSKAVVVAGDTDHTLSPHVVDPGAIAQTSDSVIGRRWWRSRQAMLSAAAVGVFAFGITAAVLLPRRAATERIAGVLCGAGEAQVTLVRHNYQLNTVLPPRAPFTKGWWLHNDGSCRWGPGMHLRLVRRVGPALSSVPTDRPLSVLADPGRDVLVEIPMRAPATTTSASEWWELVDSAGAAVSINGSGAALLAQVRVLVHPRRCRSGEESAILVGTRYADRQTLLPGQPMVAAWSLRNDGACVWPDGLRLRRVGAATMNDSVSEVRIGRAVAPGQVTTLRVPMRTPDNVGAHYEAWELLEPPGNVVRVDGARTLGIRLVTVPAMALASQTQPPRCERGEAAAGWVSESPLDDSLVGPGGSFVKVWTISNAGRCRWDDLRLQFRSATIARMSRESEVRVDAPVYPGATYSFVIPMQAPRAPGTYRETWNVRDALGVKLPRFRGRLTRPNFGAEVVYEVEEGSAA